ncbi:MAG: hypothetical protein IJJ29_12385 [Solobacterium sp.]|nr:hypothetical protein [Solobacterium sp.]
METNGKKYKRTKVKAVIPFDILWNLEALPAEQMKLVISDVVTLIDSWVYPSTEIEISRAYRTVNDPALNFVFQTINARLQLIAERED